jgi:hypothetical protein
LAFTSCEITASYETYKNNVKKDSLCWLILRIEKSSKKTKISGALTQAFVDWAIREIGELKNIQGLHQNLSSKLKEVFATLSNFPSATQWQIQANVESKDQHANNFSLTMKLLPATGDPQSFPGSLRVDIDGFKEPKEPQNGAASITFSFSKEEINEQDPSIYL